MAHYTHLLNGSLLLLGQATALFVGALAVLARDHDVFHLHARKVEDTIRNSIPPPAREDCPALQ
jgi:hypothetical protein